MITDKDLEEVQAKIEPILGQKAWGVSLGSGSFITLNFGNIRQEEKERDSIGEWYLWIYCCVWRLEKDGKILVASEDSRSKLKLALKILEGLSVISINIFQPAFDTIFVFEKNIILRLFSVYSAEYEYWMVYMPDRNVLIFGPGMEWSCIDENEF